jgi:hypothetical protein
VAGDLFDFTFYAAFFFADNKQLSAYLASVRVYESKSPGISVESGEREVVLCQ